MFRYQRRNQSAFGKAFQTLELMFHVAVRNLRKSNGNAVLGLVLSIVQALLMVIIGSASQGLTMLALGCALFLLSLLLLLSIKALQHRSNNNNSSSSN